MVDRFVLSDNGILNVIQENSKLIFTFSRENKNTVTLDESKWIHLNNHKKEITFYLNASQDFKAELGGNYFVLINKYKAEVIIGKFGLLKAKHVYPTEMEIRLTCSEWHTLIGIMDVIMEKFQYLKTTKTCFETHDNQMGYYQCEECNPNDYYLY